MMNKKITLYFVSFIATLVGALAWHSSSAAAFNANNLMDDVIFENDSAMSAAQIDSFLNGFGSSCISSNNGFTTVDPTGWSPSEPNNHGYTFGGVVTAGRAIYDAAHNYHVNPQVILTTLQKEQSLITGTAGCHLNGTSPGQACPYAGGCIDIAMGYACPGGCDDSYKGFSLQIIAGTWLLRFAQQRSQGHITGYAGQDPGDENIHYSGPMTPGYRQQYAGGPSVYWDGSYTTLDSTSVTITTGATAALYYYTPFIHGNQNFDSIFQSWFGPIYVPQYSWQLLGITYSTGTNTFGANIPGSVTVIAKNTGSVPWYNYGANPIHLGTWLPNRSSALYSSGWLSPARPANMNETEVAAGGTATFTFPINASSVGTYVEALNIVVENSQWLPWPGFSPTINIVNPYQWQVSSVTYGNGTGVMAPGTSQTVTVKALNTGIATWTNGGGPPIKLGTWGPGRPSNVADSWPSSFRATTMIEGSVAPGQTGTFRFSVRLPSSGLFYERMNLVAEGQAWFNDAGLTLYLQGGTYAWRPLWSAYSTGGNANMSRGTTFTVMIKALNTGNLSWTKTGSSSSWPIRLATYNPQDRGSFLYDSSWIRDTRPVALLENTVEPGQQGTFVFTADIPSSASSGVRNEHFNLVADGVTWFTDPGFYLYINVL